MLHRLLPTVVAAFSSGSWSNTIAMSYSSGRGRRGGGGGRGRGEYYRNKYGGGGGRSAGRQQQQQQDDTSAPRGGSGGDFAALSRLLLSIDGRQYPSYRDLITGETAAWEAPHFRLQIARVQSDPFAPPTRCRIVVKTNAYKEPNKIRSIAAADFLWRRLYAKCVAMGADQTVRGGGGGWSGPKGGDIQVMKPTQHVIDQSAVTVLSDGAVQAQITISLPARGRSVLGSAANEILGSVLTKLVEECLLPSSIDQQALKRHVDSVEDQLWLQGQLDAAGLVAFVPNGAILPRLSGVDDRPMDASTAVPFQSPEEFETSFSLPNAGAPVKGMGIRKGVSLICGGGFHGKSTLLEALQLAVYPKSPGDGREFCVASPGAVKIRSEDGRSINAVDISSFIKNLPFGKDTTCFTSADASGSTSQASNIVEALELGADTLLIDEDTCATNFMIRDNKMMKLVASEKEPITPYVQIIGSLQSQGVSTILVVGGTGDFFQTADQVIVMDCYRAVDATARAKQIAQEEPTATPIANFTRPSSLRLPIVKFLNPDGKTKVLARNVISFGDTEIDMTAQEQLVSAHQANAIAYSLLKISKRGAGPDKSLKDTLNEYLAAVDREGLDFMARGEFDGSFIRPRLFEIGAAINRLRRKCIKQK